MRLDFHSTDNGNEFNAETVFSVSVVVSELHLTDHHSEDSLPIQKNLSGGGVNKITKRSQPGIEPGTTSTLKMYHTPRPLGLIAD